MKKVLVIGDSCRDYFQYGKCERLSPEAPVPVFKPTNMIVSGGMSYNVFSNLKGLGINCDIITNPDMPRKTRYVDVVSNQMLLRVDEEDKVDRIITSGLEGLDFSQFEAVIISDYNKGFLTEEDIFSILRMHPRVFIDTKKKIGDWCRDAFCIKINQKEYQENKEALFQYYHNNLIVTSGKSGATLNREELFPIEEEHPVRDLSGAGDTFLAALVAEYIKNNDIRSAIRFANKCASWAVTQKGVVVVDLNKIKI